MRTLLSLSVIGLFGTAVSAEFYNLGPGNGVSGLSYDGSVAVGTNPTEYFIWTSSDGLIGIGGQPAGGGVGGQAQISDDALRLCGTVLNKGSGFFEMSYYDVANGGWFPLGGIGATCSTGIGFDETSSGWGISNDGMSVVGLGWFDFCGPAHAIQWNESSGMTMDLGSTVMDRSSRANAVNMDGSVVVGWQDRVDGFRQGAVWQDGVQMVIMTMSGDPVSEASDVDAAGEWVVGIGGFATMSEAWRWSEGTGVEMLGMDCPGCFMPRGFATGVSNDGSVIVGFNRGFGGPPTSGLGFIWTEETGMVLLNDYLVSMGIDTEGFNFSLPLTISGDGRTIGGLGVPEGVPFGGDGFVVTLPVEAVDAFLDIKPGSCPNSFNARSRGVLPTALLGTMDFDVTQVDVSTLALSRADGVGGSVAPARATLDDVGTPFFGELCDCHELYGDGFVDLEMKFRSTELTKALGLSGMSGGQMLELVLTGSLFDGTSFEATDCIRLVPLGHGQGQTGN